MRKRFFHRDSIVLLTVILFCIPGIVCIGNADTPEGGAPHFHNTSVTYSVAENAATGTVVGTLSAHNFKTGDGYTLIGTDAKQFLINSTTGQLTTDAVFDYETKNSYSVTVGVSQSGVVGDVDSIAVTINVTDVSEADALPSISSAEAARIVSLLSLDRIVFNEVFNASVDTQDWIELRNITAADVDLSGWRLTIATADATTGFMIPDGTLVPAGDVLVFQNTVSSDPGDPVADAEAAGGHFVADGEFILPQTAFTLILRSPKGWEDAAGNYFFGHQTPPTVPALPADTAWVRVKPNTPGTRAEAWEPSGSDGFGTPGIHLVQRPADVNSDGVVNIQDLVFVASHLGESAETGADVNGDGVVNIQDLVVVANGFGDIAAAPSANAVSTTHVDQWIRLVRDASLSGIDVSYDQAIRRLQTLRQALTPKTTQLLPNYPNPFNPETWIPYHLANATDVEITIFDVRGTLVRHLNLGHQSEGYYTSRSRAAYWDGRNERGESVASGVYFYQLQADNTSMLRKMLIVK